MQWQALVVHLGCDGLAHTFCCSIFASRSKAQCFFTLACYVSSSRACTPKHMRALLPSPPLCFCHPPRPPPLLLCAARCRTSVVAKAMMQSISPGLATLSATCVIMFGGALGAGLLPGVLLNRSLC